MKPLISILIATKNRQKYCLSAVESILMLPNENIQVIVQDNSDDKNLENMLHPHILDSRLVYQYTPPPFSSIDNFNAAIELATGEYICLIGDDDGINPEIIDATVWAKENNIDCLVGNLKANYRWENTGERRFLNLKIESNSLILGGFNGQAKLVDTKKSIIQLMKNGCTNYLEFDLPKLYHGVVKKEILDKLKLQTGSYLKGLSPDIYAAIGLSFIIDKLVVIDYPLTIPGVCSVSSSVQEGEQKSNSKDLESAPHFRDRKTPYEWEKNVPRIYCVQTLWADSGFAAIREFNQDYLLNFFDKYMLCANIIDADKSLKPMVFDFLKNTETKLTSKELEKEVRRAMFKGPYGKRILKILSILKKISGLESYHTISNVESIVDATLHLKNYLNKLNIDLISELKKTKIF